MKTIIRISAVMLAAVMLCLCLASCSNRLYAEYETELNGFHTTLTFNGKKVTLNYHVDVTDDHGHSHGDDAHSYEGREVKGKYTIEDDKMTISFESDDLVAKTLEGTHDYVKGEGYILIGSYYFELTK